MVEIHHIRDDELRTAYDSLYVNRPIRHTDSLYLWLLKLLRPKKGKLLLDIACGQGRLVELASSYGLLACGIDISYEAIYVNSATENSFLVCDGQWLSFHENSFDYITNIGSLEHYVDPLIGIREMSRVLKPGGEACILLPNIFGIFSTVLHAFHTGELADDGQPIQRYATRYKWQELLEKNGLKVEKTYKYESEWPIFLKDWLHYFRRPKAFARLMLTPVLPLNLANSFVYICKKRSKN